MGGSSSKQDASTTSTTFETTTDNSQSYGLQDVDGSNIAGGNQTVNVESVDSVITGQAFSAVERSLDSVDNATDESLKFGGNALSAALDFGSKALFNVSTAAKDATRAVGDAYAAANTSEEGQNSEQFQTTIRWLGFGALGVAAVYFIYRSGK